MNAQSLPELLQSSARRAPAAEALVQGERRLNYRQLWLGARAVARTLRQSGIGPGDRVAILHDNSIEYVTAYYGCLVAGAVAVPLNPAGRARELIGALRHSGARYLIVDLAHPEAAALREADAGVRWLATQGLVTPAAWEASAPETLEPFEPPRPDQLASIVYTSGTTGRPKGVMLSHGNLASNACAIADYLQLTLSDRVLCVLPFQFAYGGSVLHSHLAVGGCVVIENNFMYPQRVLDTLEAEAVTGLPGVPATFALLLARSRLQQRCFPRLRYVTQAGAPMAPAQIQRLLRDLPGVAFYVMYGQTEATARLCYLPPAMLERKPGSVGVPVCGVEVCIRDAEGHPLPPGAVGEVWARGPNIMQGYWRDPEATAAVLVDGWLRTGDLGWLDADGYLFLQGRSTEMIKTGAYRVAPREVEEVVAELQGVREVVALGVPDELLGQVIKLVIVPEPVGAPDCKSVRAHCRRHLAAYKLPKQIEFVADLPRTGSGKVKRHQLQTDTTE